MYKNNIIRPLRNYTISIRGGLMTLILLLLISSCKKENSDTINDEFLVDYKQENLFMLQSIVTLFSPLETEYPGAQSIREHATYGVQVFSITYKTHFKGSEINASGLVCIPLASEKFPIISFQNGTNTLHSDAPTADPLNLNYMLLEAMASNGYIILIPDYIGFGASSDQIHPYYQKESTCSSIIDMLHASNELVQKNEIPAKANNEYYLMGYSQGGWASLSTLEQLENSGQTEISVAAASCGAGAYDLMGMSNYVLGLTTFPGPLYLPYFVYSEKVYGALTDPLDKYFNPPYADNIPELFDGTHSNSQVTASLNDTISRLVTPDLIENFSTGSEFQTLRDLLTENSVSAWAVKARLRFYHGTQDLNVPPIQSQAIYDKFISAGADPDRVGHFDLIGLTHETGVIPWGINTINWFNELEGK
jgi:pimeloyl-ACP methyl ester carboxylesterase